MEIHQLLVQYEYNILNSLQRLAAIQILFAPTMYQ